MKDMKNLHVVDCGEHEDINSSDWAKVYQVLELMEKGVLSRFGMYGQTRTGKSSAGAYIAKRMAQPFYKITFTPETPMAEARGHYVPSVDDKGNPTMLWMDGPCIAAWRHGGLLLIDEIDRGGADLQSFAYALFDDPDVAALTLPKRIVIERDGEQVTDCETVRPHPDFKCIVTTNREPDELEEAVRDRFPVWLKVNEPNPQIYAQLPDYTRAMAWKCGALTNQRRINPQKFVEMRRALKKGVSKKEFGRLFSLLFDSRSREVYDMFQQASPAEWVELCTLVEE